MYDNSTEFNLSNISKVTRIRSAAAITDEFLSLIDDATRHAKDATNRKQKYGFTLMDLVWEGLLTPGETLVLTTSTKDLATANLGESDEIVWRGRPYPSPSDRTFAALMNRQSLNGWTSW